MISASKFAPSRPPVYLQTRSITASKCISKLARLRPRSSHHHGLQVHIQTRSITASKCISKLGGSQPPSVSLNSHNYGLQVRTIMASSVTPNLLNHGLPVYLQTRSITASECISKFTQSRCGETVELEGRQPIINTPLHLAWYPKGIHETERF